ncbi:Ribonuclease [Botrimarina colliarenosi]|uniref:Ribonuclease n=1 Tax=Botrimarina colliarenosi TaxID=2528001 RepID=A0A5C6AMM2_9BACT|nr:MBL fold metallo-hydrolase RNA specificity domain-containing protein [Botrimarina colliarenosi]TWU00727.1 Ribonuclease [Botrimarina colliarenosi]
MFTYEDGLLLTRARLWVDVRRRQARSFVSHAHADHMARHQLALCTPETGRLYQARLGGPGRGRLPVQEMRLGEAVDHGGLRLTALGAGHCLGSAMLLADDGERSLLYTGDFKLGESLTAAPCEPRHADWLVMESTFGRPEYRLPPRREVIERLLEVVHEAFAAGRTPVIHAYALGKSQEVTKILTTHGVPVLQHPVVWEMSRVYEACGVTLATGDADVARYEGRPLQGHAVVTLPKGMKNHRVAGLGPVTSIAVTGWAAGKAPYRLAVDHALPLSDHADFTELLEFVERVEPSRVLCTHGPRSFVDELCSRGWNAEPLAPEPQGRLF